MGHGFRVMHPRMKMVIYQYHGFLNPGKANVLSEAHLKQKICECFLCPLFAVVFAFVSRCFLLFCFCMYATILFVRFFHHFVFFPEGLALWNILVTCLCVSVCLLPFPLDSSSCFSFPLMILIRIA